MTPHAISALDTSRYQDTRSPGKANLTERGLKAKSRKNERMQEKKGVKRTPYQENGVRRVENVKRKRSQEKEMLEDMDAKRQRHQRKAAEKTSVSKDSDDISEALSGEKNASSLGLQSCQQKGLSRFKDVKGKPDQEKVAPSDKDAKRNKRQGERVTRHDAVNGRDNQAVRHRSYKLSVFFEGFPPLSKPPSPSFRGLYWCE